MTAGKSQQETQPSGTLWHSFQNHVPAMQAGGVTPHHSAATMVELAWAGSKLTHQNAQSFQQSATATNKQKAATADCASKQNAQGTSRSQGEQLS
jgi:hypothetical protein